MGDKMKNSILKTGAHEATHKNLDHFPPLIVHTCLTNDLEVLVDASKAHIDGDLETASEVISFPRRGFAPRPVEVLSASTLAAYKAIVAHMAPALPSPSRTQGAWTAHQDFGTGAHEDAYVVDIDYTACYELINHRDLKRELLLRTFDVEAVERLDKFLTGVGSRGRGLPQMLAESDLLADAYLSVIDRELERRGYSLHRYADDLRVIATDWASALRVIEETAHLAREVGLLLSSAKTSIRRSSKIREKEEEIRAVLTDRLTAITSESILEWISRNSNPYGGEDADDYEDEEDDEDDEEEEEDDEDEEGRSAYWQILTDWHERFSGRESPEQTTDETPFGPHLNIALVQAREFPSDVASDLLADLVFEDESRVESVVKYLVARHASTRNGTSRESLENLLAGNRHTVWSRLWLLFGVESVFADEPPSNRVIEWVRSQMLSDSEILRAQAIWTLASVGVMEVKDLQDAYLKSTLLSAPALSAAAGRQSATEEEFAKSKLVRAVADDSDLNKKAYQWARSSIQAS